MYFLILSARNPCAFTLLIACSPQQCILSYACQFEPGGEFNPHKRKKYALNRDLLPTIVVQNGQYLTPQKEGSHPSLESQLLSPCRNQALGVYPESLQECGELQSHRIRRQVDLGGLSLPQATELLLANYLAPLRLFPYQ